MSTVETDLANVSKRITVSCSELIDRLRLPAKRASPPIRNANEVHDNSLSPIDKAAIAVTDKVGSVGFFLIILTLDDSFGRATTSWRREVPALHWKSFDPFPAFVAYSIDQQRDPDLADAADHGGPKFAGPAFGDARRSLTSRSTKRPRRK